MSETESVFTDGPVLLADQYKMVDVLSELAGPDSLTWRGTIDTWNVGDAAAPPGVAVPEDGVLWRLQVNDNKGNGVVAYRGQYLHLTYGRLLVLDADEV
ncbi:hypothetical protein [Mycolicibacterium sp.]|uniref:hypothetical protein n=1 Tax=Mycolicibacterium sp. TaxID=2320850 RepID=UPI0037C70446